ncbi:MAG: methyltransferase domain-containing protein [Betaproteobacteria bacterium]|nr:methyltransferase domain-containing protein [Betaproteobacteria bacterium]
MRQLACLLVMFAGAATAAAQQYTGGPYVPTPQAVVDEMLRLAKVNADDVVVDLGSGDGRIVLTAAQRYGARGLGLEIDEELVQFSNAEAERLGVADRARFLQQDVLEAHIGEATVLTLYLLPAMTMMLRPKILHDLKPGTRVVSHDFDLGEWRPDRKVVVDLSEKYGTSGAFQSNVFLWTVPVRIEGEWRVTAARAGIAPFRLRLKQQFQHFEGGAAVGGRIVKLQQGEINGATIRFELALPRNDGGVRRLLFVGTVNNDAIRGEFRPPGGEAIGHWNASRAAARLPGPSRPATGPRLRRSD